MATYKVQSNGKAPKGLKKGDTVVTGGGTYKITGTNADGSYTSTKVNNTNTSSYTGPYEKSPDPIGMNADTKQWKGTNTGSAITNNTSGTTKNSQYSTSELGDTWNKNTDYQAIINKAVAAGDYVTVAKAEQLRNQKINATGSKYNTTNMYSGYLQPDYGTIGQQQMANGAGWEDVLATYNSRRNKALTTEGLDKYAFDEIQQEMWNYIVNNMKESNQPEDFTYDEEKPTAPRHDGRIDQVLSEILNRDEFSYDIANDPVYQQYADMYRREGDRAMRETMAEAAAGAGGMNTYAMTAAMQANNYYNSMLNDKIPELYQAAYDKYLKDIDLKIQDLGILQSMDNTQYNRYRDTMADWKDDRNFAYGVYQDDVQQGNWQTNFDYNSLLDNRNFAYNDYWRNKEWNYNDMWRNKEWDYNDEWRNKEWDYNDMWRNKEWNYNDEWRNKEWNTEQADKQYDRDIYNRESAKDEVWNLIKLGITPSASLIADAGMDANDVALAVAAVKAQQAQTGTGGGGSGSGGSGSGGSGGGSGKKTGNGNKTDNGYNGGDNPKGDGGVTDISDSALLNLGLGPVSLDTVAQLNEAGAVIVKNDGSIEWANGYGPHNYQEALNKLHTSSILPGLSLLI